MKDIKKYDINRRNKRDFELFVIFEQLEKERYKMGQDNELKIFENKKIRAKWVDEEEKWYFSVVDIVAVLTENDYQKARTYWKVLKNRLSAEGNETVTNCNQLKMMAYDGKLRLTDVANIEQILRLIQSIPSKKAEPLKLWLAQVGRERIDETYDPEIF